MASSHVPIGASDDAIERAIEEAGGGGSSLSTPDETEPGEDSGIISIRTGDASGDGASGGDIVIQGGDGNPGNGRGGNVICQAGDGDSYGTVFIRNYEGEDIAQFYAETAFFNSVTAGLNVFRFIGGDNPEIGFFAKEGETTPQPVVPLTTPGIQDVIDALVALGLVAQSD